jgi:hypothetical protein
VENKVDNAGQLESVDRLFCLGNMTGAGGGVKEATEARVRRVWSKLTKEIPVLTARGASLKLKGQIYRACVHRVMLYGRVTWAAKVEDVEDW